MIPAEQLMPRLSVPDASQVHRRSKERPIRAVERTVVYAA
jgi:hypothetical protein